MYCSSVIEIYIFAVYENISHSQLQSYLVTCIVQLLGRVLPALLFRTYLWGYLKHIPADMYIPSKGHQMWMRIIKPIKYAQHNTASRVEFRTPPHHLSPAAPPNSRPSVSQHNFHHIVVSSHFIGSKRNPNNAQDCCVIVVRHCIRRAHLCKNHTISNYITFQCREHFHSQ